MMMQQTFFRKPYRFILLLSLLLFLSITTQVFANTVHISDQANVLNANQIQNAASTLNYPINIYTTSTFNGTELAFDQQADAKITSTSLIVVAIDTIHRYLRIAGGTQVPLQTYQYNDAISAFRTDFNTGAGYTNATIAALQSLQNSLASANGNAPTPTSTSGGLAWLPYLPICCIGLFVLAALALFGIVRKRRQHFMRNAPIQPVNPVTPIDPMYNQSQSSPYNQGTYYGPGYQGSYNQGGIGPLGAGGLGAAAGGLLGYELGKEAGERDAQGNQDHDNFDNNDFGNGASGDFGNGGDFGAGASGDFGNNGGDTGGSGSF